MVAALNYFLFREKTNPSVCLKINWKALYFSGVLIFATMIAFCVFLVNELTRGVYLVQKYDKEINTLIDENRILKSRLAENEFFEKIAQRSKVLDFGKTAEIKYVQVLDNSLAQAR